MEPGRRHVRRASTTIALTAALCAVLPASAPASGPAPTVRLTAGFSPERLGAGTTVRLGFQIAAPPGQPPAPVTAIEVLYPEELGIATSSLGLDECSADRLREDGLAGCPAESLMGRGSALVVVPFVSGPVREPVRITLLSGPLREGHLGLLFFASGEAPVLAELIFPGLVLPAPAPFGGLLATALPLVPSVPEGPDVAIVAMQTTIGPSHITYYRRIHGRVVGYHPRGILLPRSCPRGGFPFGARLTFQDGTVAQASTVVPCPRRG